MLTLEHGETFNVPLMARHRGEHRERDAASVFVDIEERLMHLADSCGCFVRHRVVALLFHPADNRIMMDWVMQRRRLDEESPSTPVLLTFRTSSNSYNVFFSPCALRGYVIVMHEPDQQ